MRGTVIHYDELTECGLLRDETGRTHLFRPGAFAEGFRAADNQIVWLDVTEGKLRRIAAEPPPAPVVVRSVPPPALIDDPEPAPPVANGWLNWPGTLISVSALVALLLAGGEYSSRKSGQLPTLIGSFWGMLSAVLLLLEANFFRTGAGRGRVRLVAVQVILFSLLAYGLQSCEGFEADGAAQVYAYLLGALFVAAFMLPYRRR